MKYLFHVFYLCFSKTLFDLFLISKLILFCFEQGGHVVAALEGERFTHVRIYLVNAIQGCHINVTACLGIPFPSLERTRPYVRKV